jgi:hypothetical protein
MQMGDLHFLMLNRQRAAAHKGRSGSIKPGKKESKVVPAEQFQVQFFCFYRTNSSYCTVPIQQCL